MKKIERLEQKNRIKDNLKDFENSHGHIKNSRFFLILIK